MVDQDSIAFQEESKSIMIGILLVATNGPTMIVRLGLQNLRRTGKTVLGRQVKHSCLFATAVRGRKFAAVAESPELARIWTVGLEDRSSLTEEETWQQNMLLLSYFHIFDSMHYEARVGAGDSGLLLAEEPGITHLMSLPGVSEWWDENVFAYGPEFRAYVENLR